MRQLELFANELRQRAGLEEDELVDAVELAVRLLGGDCLWVMDRSPHGARLQHGADGYRIEIRDNLPDINFACAREVARWGLREFWRCKVETEHELAPQLGAALLMPLDVVLGVVERYGTGLRPVRPLAIMSQVSKTSAQLRIAEVVGDERGVVTRTGHVLVRNASVIDWNDPAVQATRHDGVEHMNLVKAPLRGGIDEGRVALVRRPGR